MGRKLRNSFFILAVIFMFSTLSFIKVKAAEEEKIKISSSYGFENNYKWGSLVPVVIEVDNNLKNIDGELQIEVPVSSYDNMGGMNNNSVSLYTQNINLPINSKKKVTINVPIARTITSLKMNIVENKKTIFTKDLSIGAALNPTDFIIGTFSDDFNSVSYINKVSVDFMGSKRNFASKLVKLDETSFPEDLSVLKSINIIFINNYDTSKLTEAKYSAIKKWVENGGLLIVGTGSSYNKSLAVFKDNFLNGDIGTVTNLQTNVVNKFMDASSGDSMKLDVLNINVKGSIPIIKEGEVPLVQKIDKGKGTIALCSFDFGLSPLTNWSLNSSFGEKLISKVLPSYYTDSNYDMIANGGINYNISNMLGNIPELPIPKASNLILIFFIYILLVAPVNYFVLKKLDKREMMWITVPAFSVFFAVIVYFAGATTRVTKPVENMISTIEIDEKGNQIVHSYGTVITPMKSDISIQPEKGLSIRPLVNLDMSVKSSLTQDNNSKNIYSRVIQGPKPALEFYNTAVFGQYSFIIEDEEVKKGSVQAEVNFSDNKVIGTVKNNTGYNFIDCYLITPSNYISLGKINNGEVRNISEPVNNYSGNAFDITNNLFGYQGPSGSSSAKAVQERRNNEQKRMLLQEYFNNNGGRIVQSAIVAIADNAVSKNILVNDKQVEKYGKSLITSKFDLSYIKDGKAEYPTGTIRPDVISTSNTLKYDNFYGFIQGDSGVIEVRFSIDSKVKVEKIELRQAQQVKNGPNFPPLTAKGYVFNATKASYEECDYNNLTLDSDKVAQYVDKDNVFKIKIDTTGLQNPGSLPQIYVKGSVK